MRVKIGSRNHEKQRFTDIYENTDKRSGLSTAIEKTARGNTAAAKRYEPRDEDFDEEGIENPYGDMYINEETVPDFLIRELGQVIRNKRCSEDDGFKREYAVSTRLTVNHRFTFTTFLSKIYCYCFARSLSNSCLSKHSISNRDLIEYMYCQL